MLPRLVCLVRSLEREWSFLPSSYTVWVFPNHQMALTLDVISYSDDEFFANMAVDAMLAVKTINPRGEIKYPVKAVNILKAHGKSATESIYVKGYALNCTVASQGKLSSRIG